MLKTRVSQLVKGYVATMDRYAARLCSHPEIGPALSEEHRGWTDDYSMSIPLTVIDTPVSGACGTFTGTHDGNEIAVDVSFSSPDEIAIRIGNLQFAVSIHIPHPEELDQTGGK